MGIIGVIMRKIEKLMIQAIENKTNWQLDNTKVEYLPAIDTTVRARIEHSKVYLHGHHIATINHEDNSYHLNTNTLFHWPTNTTKSRLRALGFNVYTKNHMTYYNDKPISQYWHDY